jgi:SAM-dependent methyltransferase
MSEYLLDKEEALARRRFDRKSEIQDPATTSYLERIGVAEGWRCLEVGGGGGSIAAWLCERVGEQGRVVATDVEPRFLRLLDRSNLEVLEHDIVSDDLPGTFDLVHAREVLCHLPEREAVLAKLVRAVRPGGWILIEDVDVSTDRPDPDASEAERALYEKVTGAIYAFLERRGLDLYFGARMASLLERLGLEQLCSEGRIHLFRGAAAHWRSAHMMAFAEIRDAVVAAGGASDQEYRSFLELADRPGFGWREALMLASWGQRPE